MIVQSDSHPLRRNIQASAALQTSPFLCGILVGHVDMTGIASSVLGDTALDTVGLGEDWKSPSFLPFVWLLTSTQRRRFESGSMQVEFAPPMSVQSRIHCS